MDIPNQNAQKNDLSVSDLFCQNWEHVRHVENERLSFTSFYFVILAAIIAFLAQAQPSKLFTLILIGLMVLISIIGALMSYRIKADMEAHGERLRRIANESSFSQYFTFGAETGWTVHIKLRIFFPFIYSILAVILLICAIAVYADPNFAWSQLIPTAQPGASSLIMTPTVSP